ncbi:hypothetical protein F4801DRAFT_41567 [Xylaria longipes]|nr:hypothetical protein F4801DRAFT_41567 [Xylaria longipes]
MLSTYLIHSPIHPSSPARVLVYLSTSSPSSSTRALPRSTLHAPARAHDIHLLCANNYFEIYFRGPCVLPIPNTSHPGLLLRSHPPKYFDDSYTLKHLHRRVALAYYIQLSALEPLSIDFITSYHLPRGVCFQAQSFLLVEVASCCNSYPSCSSGRLALCRSTSTAPHSIQMKCSEYYPLLWHLAQHHARRLPPPSHKLSATPAISHCSSPVLAIAHISLRSPAFPIIPAQLV